MVNKIKSLISSSKRLLAVLGVVSASTIASTASAAQTYDFSSSTVETNAFSGALATHGLTLILQGIAAMAGLSLILLGIGWIWRKFKKATGLGKKF